MKIVEYKIIENSFPGAREKIIKAVNEHISEGWQPLGAAIQFIYDETIFVYMQTLVKYEEQ